MGLLVLEFEPFTALLATHISFKAFQFMDEQQFPYKLTLAELALHWQLETLLSMRLNILSPDTLLAIVADLFHKLTHGLMLALVLQQDLGLALLILSAFDLLERTLLLMLNDLLVGTELLTA